MSDPVWVRLLLHRLTPPLYLFSLLGFVVALSWQGWIIESAVAGMFGLLAPGLLVLGWRSVSKDIYAEINQECSRRHAKVWHDWLRELDDRDMSRGLDEFRTDCSSTDARAGIMSDHIKE